MRKKKFFNKLLAALSSSKLALALVLLLIVFSIAGAMLPQEGLFKAAEITRWQQQHPLVTTLFKPLGLFRVFHSVPFLIIILLFTVNTLTCTGLFLYREGGLAAFKGPGAMRRYGFLFLHLSLIVLFAGGFLSTAAGLDGRILLTEGQSFKEERSNYLRLVEGPLRRENHKGFILLLKELKVKYERQVHPVDVVSYLEVGDSSGKTGEGIVKINYPFSYRGLTFTHHEIGFSPRIMIRDEKNNKLLVNSFVALKTFRTGVEWEYRDFLPLPFFKQRVIVTVYPAYKQVGDKVQKSGETPDNPMLLIEMEDESGKVVFKGRAPFRGSAEIGGYSFHFAELRRWVSFRVTDDPGYPIVLLALWMGLAAILLRYIPDIAKWR
ncbi:MAG: cytochrome c biogenesis protein ResB [Candidatus Aminicenantes bacterium]|nr:cytochrome c biogenesis protein ResB [Candidatus Aminicenantes bacterium]